MQSGGKRNRKIRPELGGALARRQIDFVQSKMLLPTYDVFDESRNFAPRGSSFCCRFAENRSRSPSAKTPGTTSSFGTAASTGLTQWSSSSKRRNFVLNISASPFWAGKRELRRKMLQSIAARYKAPVAMVNQVGGNDQLIFDGSSFVVGPTFTGGPGKVV